MNAKSTGLVLVIAGLVLAVLAAAADSIGLGAQPGMGIKQVVCLIIGIVVAVGGFALTKRPA